MKAEIDVDDRFFEVDYEIEADETIYGSIKGVLVFHSITECFFDNNQITRKELDIAEFDKNEPEVSYAIELYLTETINNA